MKKFSTIATIFAAALVAGSMSMTAFAASNPADDVSTYSYNTGRQAYEVFKAEEHPWFDNEDETTTANYSFLAGNQAAEARIEAFKAMPTGENLTDEELAAFFEKYGMPIIYDEDSPEMTPAMEKAFRLAAKNRNRYKAIS